MFRWILVVVSALMLISVSLQPALACEQPNGAAASSLSLTPDDDGTGPAAPDLAIEMPDLFPGRAPWALVPAVLPAPLSRAERLAPPPYVAPLLRPPRQST
ncbi:MAG: hypothetical protein JO006_19520 [Paucibacter sp.]|nr:hypothetical protein [Roseateles sp.]